MLCPSRVNPTLPLMKCGRMIAVDRSAEAKTRGVESVSRWCILAPKHDEWKELELIMKNSQNAAIPQL